MALALADQVLVGHVVAYEPERGRSPLSRNIANSAHLVIDALGLLLTLAPIHGELLGRHRRRRLVR